MNTTLSPHQRPSDFLRQLFAAAVARAQPLLNLPAVLPAVPRGRTVVIGAGKAAGAMAQALEQLWPADAPLSGVVVTPTLSRMRQVCKPPSVCWRWCKACKPTTW